MRALSLSLRSPVFLGLLLASALMSPVAVRAGFPCEPLPEGAIAWYSAERHADDLAGFYNGSFDGGATYVDGHVGEAFAFNANNAVFTATDNADGRAVRNSFSYELWVRPTKVLGVCAEAAAGNCGGSSLAWAIFPTHGDAGAPGEEIGLGAGVGVAIGTDGICVGEHAAFHVPCTARLNTAIPNNAMTHVVVVVENKTPRIYVNGTFARTGVGSSKQFVFASWQVIGSGLGLGKYEGDLDEVTIYGRALSDVEIADLFIAGNSGKCRPGCAQRSDDPWQGATVTANSALVSNNASGMFGGTQASPELTSTLFADNQADGTVHTVDWEIANPVRLAGFTVSAFHDAFDNTQRAFRRLRIQAREVGGLFQTVYDSPVVVPYAPGSRDLIHCVNLRPVIAQQFHAEFTQDGPPGFSGPRVLELDALGLSDNVFRDGFETP